MTSTPPRPSAPVELPPGRELALPGRGCTFVREVAGPAGPGGPLEAGVVEDPGARRENTAGVVEDPGARRENTAPTLLLLHGLTATADLNWFNTYRPLGEKFRVVAFDQRGHGRGVRVTGRFRLADCADDAAAVIDALGTGPVIAVGYSMGGPVAQLLWRRHPDHVAGLVLCATSRDFSGDHRTRLAIPALAALSAVARVAPATLRQQMTGRFLPVDLDDPPARQWALSELRANDPANVLGAAASLLRFSSREWIGDVDVPTAVVVTARDRLVPPRRQYKLAASIPGATVHVVDADHDAAGYRRFVPVLLEACASVAARVAEWSSVPSEA